MARSVAENIQTQAKMEVATRTIAAGGNIGGTR
jgi:hypothetical protein